MEKVGDSYMMVSPRVAAERRWAENGDWSGEGGQPPGSVMDFGRCWGGVLGRCWGGVPGWSCWRCHHRSGNPGHCRGGIPGRPCWGVYLFCHSVIWVWRLAGTVWSRYHGRDGLLPARDRRVLVLGSDRSGSRGGGGGLRLSLMLVRCGNSTPRMDINLFDHSSDFMDCLGLLCDTGKNDVSSIYDSPGVFHQHWLLTRLSNTGLLAVTGVRFNVFEIGLFRAADSVRFGSELVMSDVTEDGNEIPMTTAACSLDDGFRCCVWLKFVSLSNREVQR